MPDIAVKKQDYSRCEHWKILYYLYEKKVYKLTLLVVVEAVAAASPYD